MRQGVQMSPFLKNVYSRNKGMKQKIMKNIASQRHFLRIFNFPSGFYCSHKNQQSLISIIHMISTYNSIKAEDITPLQIHSKRPKPQSRCYSFFFSFTTLKLVICYQIYIYKIMLVGKPLLNQIYAKLSLLTKDYLILLI